MQVKNNGLFTGIQKKSELPGEGGKKSTIKNFLAGLEKTENRESLVVDKIRSQVMNLHGEVKDIQTKISFRQIQIAFLENLPDKTGWKEELKSFMKENFSGEVSVKPDPDLESYLTRLGTELKVLNNDMLTREIKLENIISSGLIDGEKSGISNIIIKDIEKANDVFSRIKTENIIRVLKA